MYYCDKCKRELGKTTWVHYNGLCGSCYYKWVDSLTLIEKVGFLKR